MHFSPRRCGAALLCAGVAALAACSTPASPAPPPPVTTTAISVAPVGDTAVSITDFAFVPAALTVKVGDAVTWTNHDEEPHTVAAGDGSFHSPGMDTNGTFSFTFTEAGTFDYVCSIHPFMHGTVTVTR
jgi:amicyanin